MEQGLIQFAESSKMMSSLEIAELTGKSHAHVMRDIRNIIKQINQSTSGLVIPDDIKDDYHRGDRTQYKFLSEKTQNILFDFCFNNTGSKYIIQESSYKDAKGEERNMYELNKKACLLLSSGYDVNLRAKIIDRWEELETGKATPAYQLPQSYADALRELAGKVEENERLALENKHQAEVIEEQKPKVVFADAIVGSQSSCLIGELAKIITQNGYKIGQNRLFEWLRNNHFLGTTGEFYNIPNQKYVEQGLFEIKKTSHSENGVMKTTCTPKVTGKGQQYFVNLFLKGDLTLFEREIILPNND